jgi:hypothetical protein
MGTIKKESKQKLIRANDVQAYREHKGEVVSSKYKERKTGDDSYRIWQNRLAAALRFRQNHWNGTKNWDKAYELYRGKHWNDQDDVTIELVKSDNRRDRITVNLTGSTIQNMLPFLLSTKPQFVCHPTKPTDYIVARLQGAVVNHQYKERKVHPQVKRAGLDCVIMGHGIVETGYILELDEAIKSTEGEIVYADYIRAEAPYAKRVSPYNFLWDYMSSEHDLATSRWCAEIVYMPMRDVLANSNHLKSTIRKIESGEYTVTCNRDILNLDRSYLDEERTEYNEEDELAVLYKVWDKKYRKYYLFADGVLPPLVEKDWPYPYLDGFPYRMVEFIPVPDCPFPMGLALAIEDQQHELNAIRTRMFRHGRRFNRKYEVVATQVDPKEVEKLVTGEDGTHILVKAINSISPINDAQMSPDHHIIESRIQDDIQRLSGQDSLIQGGALPSRTTAGEVNARGNLFRMKLDDRVESMDNFVLGVGEDILAHIKANMLSNRVIQIAGPEGKYWVEFSVEDIQDPVDMTMESIAAPKTDPQIMRQQALQQFQIIMSSLPQLMQLGVSSVQELVQQFNFVELFKWMFENLEVRDAGRFFKASLVPNQPLEYSNDLNIGQDQPQPNTQVSSVQDLQRQGGLAPVLNQSGLQI